MNQSIFSITYLSGAVITLHFDVDQNCPDPKFESRVSERMIEVVLARSDATMNRVSCTNNGTVFSLLASYMRSPICVPNIRFVSAPSRPYLHTTNSLSITPLPPKRGPHSTVRIKLVVSKCRCDQ